MRYVVAGVSGRTGSVVARELLARGHRITVLVRDIDQGLHWGEQGADVAVGSLANQTFLEGVLTGADGFYTLLPEPFHAPDFATTRREMGRAIAGAVAASRVPRVVMLSTTAACLTSGNGPACELRYLEDLLCATAARVTSLRAAQFQDGVAAMIPLARQGFIPSLLPSPDLPVPMVATRDVGEVAAAELTTLPSRSDVVDLVGPAYTARDVAATLALALGSPVDVMTIPPEDQVAQLVRSGFPESLAVGVAELTAAVVAGRVVPRGDRLVAGRTTLEHTVMRLLESKLVPGSR